MTLTLFYSFLSGFCEFFGLFPVYIWQMFENIPTAKNAGVSLAVAAGLLNGILLVLLKLKTTKKEITEYLAYGLLGLASFLLMPVIDLRTGGGILLVCAAVLFINNRMNEGLHKNKLLWCVIAISSMVPYLPIGLCMLSLVSFKYKLRQTMVRRWAIMQIPALLAHFYLSLQEFIKDSGGGDGLTVALSYLFTCLGVYLGLQLLVKLSSEKRTGLIRKGLVFLGCIILYFTSRYGNVPAIEQAYVARFSSMGTVCDVTVWNSSSQKAERILLKAQKVFDDIENTLSTYKPESEISQLNKNGHLQAHHCSDILWQNLMVAEEAWKVSNGAFDVTIGPLVKLWGIKRKRKELPTTAEIAAAKEKVGFDKLIIDHTKRTLKFSRGGLRIDFGGLTKGWAVDQVRDMFYANGIFKGLINLGGNIYCLRQPPLQKKYYAVGVKNPLRPDTVHMVVNMLGQGIATSGNYEQFIMIDGKRYTHIIDPRTGMPVDTADGVTVISSSATWCDVLSTAIFIEGQPLIEKLSKGNPGLNVWFVKRTEEAATVNKTYGPIWQGVTNKSLK